MIKSVKMLAQIGSKTVYRLLLLQFVFQPRYGSQTVLLLGLGGTSKSWDLLRGPSGHGGVGYAPESDAGTLASSSLLPHPPSFAFLVMRCYSFISVAVIKYPQKATWEIKGLF